MHMFTFCGQGASEFSLVPEMGRLLPRLQLRHSKETLLDGGPATGRALHLMDAKSVKQ
ncbi:hypothetical protein PO883_32925 [Massilia sp. DJPM01]|uniref:hypothetical protein n=1 Tax=Massilia sp. DJPM01 TaxID=3024404 RepID=UPI00259DE27B|nr:hypothetical protein [Massilia sp. DJPM01]MDM5181979.1 hypothetical protein [Massilia sp. DJPM01]